MDKTIDIFPSKLTEPAIQYAESDGEPMGETGFHINAILYLYQALRHFFQQAKQVYVAANMLLYYEEGNSRAFKVPDIFVVKDVAKHDRRIYKLWEEQMAPCVVFEITSSSTRLEDLGNKRALYEMLGVNEYFLFDPLAEYLSPQLQGFHLVNEYYQPMAASSDGTLYSGELNIVLRPDDNLLRVVDPSSNQAVPTLDESVEQMQAAEAELARLKAELERLRRQAGEDQ